MMNLSGRVALVTGASQGIGKATALTLARLGAKVGAAARNIQKLDELSETAKNENLSLLPIPMDITKNEEIEHGMTMLIHTFGRLDILVCSAGISKPIESQSLTEKDWDETLDTNLKGAFFTAKSASSYMEKERWGRIVFLTSILSGGIGTGLPQEAHYGASKGGIVGMTASMAIEFAPLGILVNSVGPGYIKTDMTKAVEENPQRFQNVIQRIPLKRFGEPQEIANVIAFLVSEENSYMTGTTVYVDGGYVIG